MSFQLGDVVPLSVTVKDAGGNPANAGSVVLTVTLPDGTTATPSVTNDATGVYNADYPTVQAGRHGVRWVATGTNASAFTDAFDVEPADDGDFVSLADVKRHMNKTSANDDQEMAGFISAACQMIVERIGPVSPVSTSKTIWRRHIRRAVILDLRPVIEVASVTADGVAIPQADPDTGTDGWELNAKSGVLTHSRRWPPAECLHITYRAGRTPVPGNIRLAALELCAHLWRASQQNFGGGRPGLPGADDVVMPGAAYALPIRVRELLGLGAQPTAEPLVG